MRLSPPVAPVAIQTATRLRRQLAAGSQVDASHFWREANSLALPLVTAINGADDERKSPSCGVPPLLCGGFMFA